MAPDFDAPLEDFLGVPGVNFLLETPPIKVQSFLKVGKEFVPVTAFTGPIRDFFYIEGAIELQIGDVVLLDQSMWDLVDQLWAYFAEGLELVAAGESFSTYMPDQALKVSFLPKKDKSFLAVEVECHGVRRTSAHRRTFLQAMTRAGEEFFGHMIPLLQGRGGGSYEPTLRQLQDLRQRERL